jgi:hypothetical protein
MVEKKAEVAALAELLLAKETINHDDIVATIGHRPFEADTQYADYISNALGIKKQKEKDGEEGGGNDDATVTPPNLSPI